MGWYDRTDGRKIHTGNIPRLGGIGFTFSFAVFFIIVNFCFGEISLSLTPQFFLVALACMLIVTSGLRDDFKPLAPRYKLILQTSAALCVVVSGHVFKRLLYIDRGDVLGLAGWKLLRYPLSFLWVVGITNAINFIDGVDGLAGGVSLLAVLSFGIISVSLGAGGDSFLICAGLAAAILGFLVFNGPFPHAKIFMGDGGAYFLGFVLALLPLTGKGSTGVPVFYAAAVLQIPIFDAIAAVWRRMREGRRIDSPDRSHTHHKLMNLGLSPRRIDALLFILQICLGVLVYAAVKLPGYVSLVILVLAYAVGIGFFTALHFLNRRAVRVLSADRIALSWKPKIIQSSRIS
jgi:UDP-GlcNAc:undecaprenyl-phosphate GlcNAc-1-phosphate transferase